MVPAVLARWLAPMALAAGLGVAALTPVSARADEHRTDDFVRVVVDIADVIFRGGHPYYRHGGYGYGDRLIVVHDRYGHPAYYREVPRDRYHRRSGPPYGEAHGHWRGHRAAHDRRVVCDHYGRCVTRYYDPRYDRRYYTYHDPRDRYDDHDRWRHHHRDD